MDQHLPRRIYRAATVVAFLFFLLGVLVLLWLWDIRDFRQLAATLLGSYLFIWAAVSFFSDASRRERHLRFALTTFVLAVMLAALEALSITGLIDYRSLFGNRLGSAWHKAENQFDEELLWRRRPFLERSGKTRGNISRAWCLPANRFPEYPYKVRYDRNGFRNEEELSTAPIVVLGDSYLEGLTIPYEKTLTSQLARLSGAAVRNLALAGYAPQQELSVLRVFALPLQPEVIVWAFYEGNDLSDVTTYERNVSGLESGRLQSTLTLRERSFSENALRALDRLRNRCDTYPRADRRVGVYRAADAEMSMYFLDAPRPLWGKDLAALSKLGETLAQAYELSAQSDARLVVLYVPIKYRVYGDLVEIPERSDLREWMNNSLPARVESLVGTISPKFGFLDLTRSFVSAAAGGRVLYYPDDTHWTAEGHLVAAEALWEYLSNANGDAHETRRESR